MLQIQLLVLHFYPLVILFWTRNFQLIFAVISDPSALLQSKHPTASLPFGTQNATQLELNPEKLDLLLHNVAIFSLLKAKANALTKLPEFPLAESLLYRQCSGEAKTPVQLAKCIVPLIRARDGMRQREEATMTQMEKSPTTEMDWPSRIGKWLMANLAKFKPFGDNGKGKMDKTNGREKAMVIQRRRKMKGLDKKAAKQGSLKIRKLPKSQKQKRGRQQRTRRAVIKVPTSKWLQRMFQPNGRQAKRRAEAARAKRQGKGQFGGEEVEVEQQKPQMDLFNGKNVPWYMEPVGQLLRLAKAILSGKKPLLKKRNVEEKNGTVNERRGGGGEAEENWRGRRRAMEDNGKKQEEKEEEEEEEEEELPNIEKLRRIQHFYEMSQHCERHLAKMGEANSRFVGHIMPTKSGPIHFQMGQSEFDSLADELQGVLANYSFESFPILSPRLLSLFPDASADAAGKNQPNLLSPKLFSFHREGLFSMPTLFGLMATSEKEMLSLLDLFMELSGASRVLGKILTEIEPRRKVLEQQLYPTIVRLEQMEKRWDLVRESLREEQKMALDRGGYTMLDEAQFGRLYGRRRAKQWTLANEQQLEEDIQRMALMADENGGGGGGGRNRAKRQTASEGAAEQNMMANTSNENGTNPIMVNGTAGAAEEITSLRPFLYTNLLRQNAPVAVNGIVLSPRAFATALMVPNFMWLNVLSPSAFGPNILSPRAAALTVLSPTAFTANILTPNTLWTEVLSPKFFHSNILSPRALAALMLSPRTMLGEVLSPKMIEFRLLNPGTFFAGVLTPNLLMPRVLSPSNFGVTVLSPNILSPSILSRGNFTVQVLSPSIMSDDVTAEQFARGEWQKPNATTTPAPKMMEMN